MAYLEMMISLAKMLCMSDVRLEDSAALAIGDNENFDTREQRQ